MTLSFQIKAGLKKALQQLANEERRSLSNFITLYLEKLVEEKGMVVEDEPKGKK